MQKFVALSAAAFICTTVRADEPSPGCCVVYTEEDFTGDNYSFCHKINSLGD